MTRRTVAGRVIPLLLVGISCAFLTGCAGFQTQSAFIVYKAPLDADRAIELREFCQYNDLCPGPTNNFVTLGLYLTRHSHDAGVGAVIIREPYDRAEDVDEIDISSFDVRTNAERDKVWVIDRSTNRVVGSLHCTTGYATGQFDVPPEWASLVGGERLESYRYPFTVAQGPR